MDDREKLVALLDTVHHTPLGKTYHERIAAIADYLIYNGVRLETKQATSDENKRWIHISERPPEPFTTVLVYDRNNKEICIAYQTRHLEWVGIRMNGEVIYWRPLPELTKEVE